MDNWSNINRTKRFHLQEKRSLWLKNSEKSISCFLLKVYRFRAEHLQSALSHSSSAVLTTQDRQKSSSQHYCYLALMRGHKFAKPFITVTIGEAENKQFVLHFLWLFSPNNSKLLIKILLFKGNIQLYKTVLSDYTL